MKKIACILLFCITVTLASCGRGAVNIAVYDKPGRIPTHMISLHPEVPSSTEVAVLLRRYDESSSAVAVSDRPGGELTTVYTLPEGTVTYEVVAEGGIIAFYEISAYSDGSVSYALRAVDTANGGKVHSPYKKTVSEDGEIQTRFIVVYDRCVYYLTKADLLGRSRVMKYSLDSGVTEEFLGFPFTENEMTSGSSCTFISGKSGYLSCGVVSGNRTVIKTYELGKGELVREKQLPYGAALVYMADHDYATGMYAMYYLSAQNDERVAVFSYSDETLTDILELDGDTYVSREEVLLYGDSVYFQTQDTNSEDPYSQFRGYSVKVADGDTKEYAGCMDMFINGGEAYALTFDKRSGYGKVDLSRADAE